MKYLEQARQSAEAESSLGVAWSWGESRERGGKSWGKKWEVTANGFGVSFGVGDEKVKLIVVTIAQLDKYT